MAYFKGRDKEPILQNIWSDKTWSEFTHWSQLETLQLSTAEILRPGSGVQAIWIQTRSQGQRLDN